MRTQELTSATKNALRHSEMVAALEGQRKDYIAGRAPRAPLLPANFDEMSVAGSVISEGTHSVTKHTTPSLRRTSYIWVMG